MYSSKKAGQRNGSGLQLPLRHPPGTRLGVGVVFFAGIVIFGIAAFILEKRPHKMNVDRGPKGDDEDSFWN